MAMIPPGHSSGRASVFREPHTDTLLAAVTAIEP